MAVTISVAEKLAGLRALTGQLNPPYDPEPMIRFYEFRVIERDMPEHALVSMTTREVFVNRRLPPAGRRFWLFHELGHILLHQGLGRPMFADDGHEPLAIRRAADKVAEEGSIPLEDLVPFIAEKGRSPKLVAEHFGVSLKTAEIRLSRVDPTRRPHTVPYEAAINSERWETLRDLKRKATGGRCQGRLFGCRGTGTDLHHLHYDMTGRETLDDVLWLCGPCHSRFDDLRRRSA